MAERNPPEQIPWAERTKVTYQSDLSIELQGEFVKIRSADVWHKDFEWNVSVDSKAMIASYLKLHYSYTRDIQEFWKRNKYEFNAGADFLVREWMKSDHLFRPLPKEGSMEWRPRGSKKIKFNPMKGDWSGENGQGNTYNEDTAYWWGDEFEFFEFENDEGEEGAIILWKGNVPEVWMGGRFEDFMDSQRESDPFSWETFLAINGLVENGFMWAFEKLGYFDDPNANIVDLEDQHVKQALKAIKKAPEILLPESVEKVLRNFDSFPKEIQTAVNWLMANKRRELERALGQKLIWGDLYPPE